LFNLYIDNASESEEEWEDTSHTSEEFDFASNNIHNNYAAVVDAARWVIRK
jgi:hypothetical protein